MEACEGLSNVTIVCSDGIVPSHKIIIAMVSDFIKEMLIPIAAAEDVSIFLPDFQTSQVQSVIDQFFFGGTQFLLWSYFSGS